jgi:hypothetical protein
MELSDGYPEGLIETDTQRHEAPPQIMHPEQDGWRSSQI